jgi:hypothetical protein
MNECKRCISCLVWLVACRSCTCWLFILIFQMAADIDASYQFQGIPKMIQDCVHVCDVDIRRELFGAACSR